MVHVFDFFMSSRCVSFMAFGLQIQERGDIEVAIVTFP